MISKKFLMIKEMSFLKLSIKSKKVKTKYNIKYKLDVIFFLACALHA